MSDAASSVLSGAIEGSQLSNDELSFLEEESPAGLTFFARNLEGSQKEISDLTSKIQQTLKMGEPPYLLSIDQEGGRVSRLKKDFPDLGPAMNLFEGKADQSAADGIAAYGREVSEALLKLGINCNFAPVVDVLTEETNTAIGDRAFARNSADVVIRAGAFLGGMKSAGLLTCLKHFPGQGAARVDTHKGTAEIDIPMDLLKKRDLFPFTSLQTVAPMIMVSHCIYPAMDEKEASRSHFFMTELLRKEMKYEGVIVTDDMTMGAIVQDEAKWHKMIIESISAGADLILICRGLDRWKSALAAIRAEERRNHVFAARLHDAASRVNKLRESIK